MAIGNLGVLAGGEEDTTDYKDLLKRYIQHVWQSEGTDFIDDEDFLQEPAINSDDRLVLRQLTKE